jgi:hypothetical protein
LHKLRGPNLNEGHRRRSVELSHTGSAARGAGDNRLTGSRTHRPGLVPLAGSVYDAPAPDSAPDPRESARWALSFRTCRYGRLSRAAGRSFLPLWGILLHALAEAATRVLAGPLRASLHPTAEPAAAAQAAEPPREPFAEPSESAARRTATHALGKALLGLVGCGGVLVRSCHRVGALLVPVTEIPEGTISFGRIRVAAQYWAPSDPST